MRNRVLIVLPLLVLAIPAMAQRVRVGAKGGVPINEYFETGPGYATSSYSSATRRYTFGPSVEFNLWNNVGLEFDALYKRIGYNAIVSNRARNPPFYTDTYEVTGSSWDFPLMLKYRFTKVPLYATAGGMIRHIGPVHGNGERSGLRLVVVNGILISDRFTEPLDVPEPFDLRKRTWSGVTVATGVELRNGRFRVLPEFRYTRITSNISEPSIRTLGLNQNQAEFLLGFLF